MLLHYLDYLFSCHIINIQLICCIVDLQQALAGMTLQRLVNHCFKKHLNGRMRVLEDKKYIPRNALAHEAFMLNPAGESKTGPGR